MHTDHTLTRSSWVGVTVSFCLARLMMTHQPAPLLMLGCKDPGVLQLKKGDCWMRCSSDVICATGQAVGDQRDKYDIATKFGAAGNVGASAKVHHVAYHIS